jgi:ribosome-associated toxin RatA of RatAB toxin-antitoxin module
MWSTTTDPWRTAVPLTDRGPFAAAAPFEPVLTSHATLVEARPDAVYAIVADAAAWPLRFASNVHVERLEQDRDGERIQIWSTSDDEVRTWVSRRRLDAAALRVSFRQEAPSPPVASMAGAWILSPAGKGKTLTELTHEFSSVDGAPDGIDRIVRVTDRSSVGELAAVKMLAEKYDRLGELEFAFEDTVHVDGDADDVFDFLYRAEEWPGRLPYVDRLELREDLSGVQLMEADMKTANGQVYTTRSIRVPFGKERIVYKQIDTSRLVFAHVGQWAIKRVGDGAEGVGGVEGAAGVDLTSRHSVALRPEAIPEMLGDDADALTARVFIRDTLSGNSTATLKLAKAYAEDRRMRLSRRAST